MIQKFERKPTIVIAGHGSSARQQANVPYFELADCLARNAGYRKVVPAFLDGNPGINSVLDTLDLEIGDDVYVVPAMTAEGYYAKNVVPKLLAENRAFNLCHVHSTRSLGTHPGFARLAAKRIEALANRFQLDLDKTTAFVVGHGTRRNPDSGKTTFELAHAAAKLTPAHVVTAFIDQDPELDQVVLENERPNRIVIPFLMGFGPHATEDVPEAFGIFEQPAAAFPFVADTTDGFTVCDQPLGTHLEVVEFIQDLVAHASRTRAIAGANA